MTLATASTAGIGCCLAGPVLRAPAPGPPRAADRLTLPWLLISLRVFCSKNMYCAVVAGYTDEGSILIEVNTVGNTDRCCSSTGTYPQLLLCLALLPQLPWAPLLRPLQFSAAWLAGWTAPLGSHRGPEPCRGLPRHRHEQCGQFCHFYWKKMHGLCPEEGAGVG